MGNGIDNLKKSWFGKFLFLAFLGLTIFVFLSFWNSFLNFKQAEKRVEEKKRYIEGLKKEKENLENKVREIKSEAYIEKRLRDDLSMAKEGEIIVVLPEDEVIRSLSTKKDSEVGGKLDLPNWRKWLIFFGF